MDYRAWFLGSNGSGPWPCAFCGTEVAADALTVHHVDGDHGNNAWSNWAASHLACHRSHHGKVTRYVMTIRGRELVLA